jgi:UDP-N-acetylglucosamine--N-acetylmuramyl-(pentapeptide) pyrophosphoryl-undecaprenol N-acetylglucosamine transferase
MALADELSREGIEVHIAGAKLESNRFFDKQAHPYTEVSGKPGLKGLPYIGKGTLESLFLLKRVKPDLIVGFGCYTSFPLLMAGTLKKIPMLLWAADAKPGKVVRWFSPYAKLTALQIPSAALYLKGETAIASMPLRKGYTKSAFDKKCSLDYFGVTDAQPIVLVMGGSQGAKEINRLAPQAIKYLPKGVQVLHFAGSDSEAASTREAYAQEGIKAIVKVFEPLMHHAWRVADVALTRAGAVSCSEQLEFEVPGVLIPFPQAADNHQKENGQFLKSTGLVEMVMENEASAEKLAKLLTSVLFSATLRQQKARQFKNKLKVKSLKEWVKEFL